MRLTFWLLKVARGNTRLGDDLDGWDDDVRAVLDGRGSAEVFVGLVVYIWSVAETPPKDLHDFFDKLGPDAKEAYMTTAEMLRTEGRTEGLAKGLAKGRTEGRAETVVKQMTVKFGPLPDAVLATVRAATPDQLNTWAVRVLTADTLDEVLH